MKLKVCLSVFCVLLVAALRVVKAEVDQEAIELSELDNNPDGQDRNQAVSVDDGEGEQAQEELSNLASKDSDVKAPGKVENEDDVAEDPRPRPGWGRRRRRRNRRRRKWFGRVVRKWKGHVRKWKGHVGKWKGHVRKWKGHVRKWKGHVRKWKGHVRKWKGHVGKWKGHMGKWIAVIGDEPNKEPMVKEKDDKQTNKVNTD